MNLQINPYTLPASAFEIYKAIGLDALLALVGFAGGTEVSIPSPSRLTRDSSLSDALGYEAALKLCEQFGGDSRFRVPTCRQAISAARVKAMREARATGRSATDVAREFGVTDTYVRRVAPAPKSRSVKER